MEGPPQLPFTAFGTKGTISLAQTFDEEMPVTLTRDGVEETIELKSPDRFRVQIDEFSECILTGKAPDFPAEDGLKNLAVMLALYKSAHDRSIVAIDSF